MGGFDFFKLNVHDYGRLSYCVYGYGHQNYFCVCVYGYEHVYAHGYGLHYHDCVHGYGCAGAGDYAAKI